MPDMRKYDMREDVESWSVRAEREWPYSRLTGQTAGDPAPLVRVVIGVNFISEASAVEFEQQVRSLLVPEKG